MTGPFGSSAGPPCASCRGSAHCSTLSYCFGPLTFSHFIGTPNSITLPSPFFMSGPRNSSSRSTPQRRWPGKLLISVDAPGSSVMKIGYMSISFVSPRRDCHERESGCWYPPCRIDEISSVDIVEGEERVRTSSTRESGIGIANKAVQEAAPMLLTLYLYL
jgi:hypothetical protein